MSRQKLVVILLGLNLLLAAALLLSAYAMPAAFAQTAAGPGNFIAATAAVDGQEYEVLYVLDASARRLYAFAPTSVQTRALRQLDVRDLEADFRRAP